MDHFFNSDINDLSLIIYTDFNRNNASDLYPKR